MKRNVLTVLLLTLFSVSIAQNGIVGSMRIMDEVVVKRSCKDAVKLHVELKFNSDSLVIVPLFQEFINSDGMYSALNESGMDDFCGNYGLSYLIEDTDGNFIQTGYPQSLASFEDYKDEERYYNSRWILNKKTLKAKFKLITDDEERKRLDHTELIVHRDTVVCIYPMIFGYDSSRFPTNDNLPPGDYWLYLFYSHKNSYSESFFDDRGVLFSGVMISNKVRLIVK